MSLRNLCPVAWFVMWLSSFASAQQELPSDLADYFRPPQDWGDQYGKYRSPLVFADGRRVQDAGEWKQRRAELRQEWEDLLGTWPPLVSTPEIQLIESVQHEGYVSKKIRFLWTPDELTTGYLLVPDDASKTAPAPAVLCVYYEPESGVGLGKPLRDFALQLTRRGFVTLSIGTTQATKDKTYSLYYPNIESAEVQPLSMLAYAAANAWYVLASCEEVDDKRIGVVGHSFGGKWAMFASCLFDRFACAAWSDPGIVFDTRPSVNYWEPWYLGYHPKPWRRRGVPTAENPAKGLYPQLLLKGRDLHELHALMAPRPFWVSGGSEDGPRRWAALNHSVAVNELLGFKGRVGMSNRAGHAPTVDSNELIYRFFQHFLQ